MTDVPAAAAPPDPAAVAVAPAPTGRRAVADIAVQVVGRLGNGLLGVVVMILIARALGTGGFGQWSTLTAVVALAGPLTELGIQQVAVTRAAEQPAEEGGWIAALLVVRCVLGVLATLLCLAAVLVLGSDGSMRLAGVLLVATVLLSGLTALTAVFQLRIRNDIGIVVMTISSVLWTGAVVAVDLAGGGLVALAAAFLVATSATALLQAGLGLRRLRPSFAGWVPRGRELVRVGLPLSIATVLVLAYGRIDQILVFSIAGEHAAGLYGAAYRILDQAGVVPLSVATTLFPVLAAANRVDPARMLALLQRALEVLLAVSLGALAFAIPCGGDALGLVFGAQYAAAGPALAVLMGAFGLTCVNYLNGSVVLICGLQRRTLVYAAVGLVVNLALNATLIGPFGYIAAAWATVATEGVVVVLTSRATLSALAWRPELAVPLRALAAAVATALGLAVLRHAGVPIEALLPLAGALYVGLLAALGGIRVRETLALVRPA